MLKPFIRGSNNVGAHNSADEKIKKTCKCRTFLQRKRVKKIKNPYATRGLDKFSSLVAELEEKRLRIYAQTKDSYDDVYVWFNFSGSDACKPIILKMEKKQLKGEQNISNKSQATFTKAMVKINEPRGSTVVHKTEIKKSEMTANSYYTNGLRRRPLLHLLGAVILILILLLVFGRPGAVIWLTIVWYLLPNITVTRYRTKPRLEKKTKDHDAPAKIQVMSHERADQQGHRRS